MSKLLPIEEFVKRELGDKPTDTMACTGNRKTVAYVLDELGEMERFKVLAEKTHEARRKNKKEACCFSDIWEATVGPEHITIGLLVYVAINTMTSFIQGSSCSFPLQG